MFTGIIEAEGRVEEIRPRPVSKRLTVATGLDLAKLPIGASIAVDGVCLTVVDRGSGRFSADVGPETLARTTLGDLRAGDRVHLERPLRLGDPVGGHLVQGHVDGTGRIASSADRGDAREIQIDAPPEVARALFVKGSIAVDGISLTINQVRAGRFSVTLIPHTLAVTALGGKPVGARVNLEADPIAKQVEALVTRHLERETRTIAGGPVISIPLPIGRPRKQRDRRKIRLPRKQPW